MNGRERPFLKIQGFEADIPWLSKLDLSMRKHHPNTLENSDQGQQVFDNGGCFKSHVQTEIKEGRQKRREEKRKESRGEGLSTKD